MDLHRLMAPRSVAVVGASPRLGSYGNQALLNLRIAGFEGKAYGVHPNARDVHGFPCVPTLSDLPDAVDAVVVATPAATVPALVDEAGRLGCGGAVVIAAGFGEVEQGRGLQDDLRAAAEKHSLPVCGPNGNGIVALHQAAPLWGDAYRALRPGSVALVSQSGNVAVNALAVRQGLRLHTVVSCGNQAVLDASDYLHHLAATDGVRSVALYLEAEGDGRRLALALAECAANDVGVVVLKAGRSSVGATAAAAHTGAVAGDAQVLCALVEEAGAAWVDDPHSLLEVAKAMAHGRRRAGKVAVVTCSGGDAATSADEAERLGIPLAELAPATTAALGELLPPTATVVNPLDYTAVIWGDAPLVGELVRTVGGDPDVGQVVVYYDRPEPLDEGSVASWDATLDGVIAGASTSAAPVLVASTLPSLLPDATADRLVDSGVPPVAGLTTGLLAADALRRPTADVARLEAVAASAPSLAAGGEWLAEHEAKDLLRDNMIAVPRGQATTSVIEAVEVARSVGGRVALKLSAADLQHKSDAGALELGVHGDTAVRVAFDRLRSLRPDATVLVEEMVEPGVEVMVSVRRDGPVPALVVALGGLWVEVLQDAAVVCLPAEPSQVRAAIGRLAAAPLLLGGRGSAPVGVDALVTLAVDVAALAEREDLALVELNPVIVTKARAVAVDALIRRGTLP